jgi:hypothetical protein
MSASQDGRLESPANITPTAWVPNRDLDIAEWVAAGRLLGGMGRCSQWGLGDWIRYGNAKFGQRYARAVRITGYDRQTLMNMVYVASQFEISRRREILSWSHHETLAGLEPDEQEHWLDVASANHLSQRDLRDALRASRGNAKAVPEGHDDLVGAHVVTCPHCGGEVPVPTTMAAVAA